VKRSFWDTVPGFGIKLFGVILLTDVLILILSFIFTALDELLGAFLTNFIINGIGILSIITAVYTTAWQKGFRDIGLVSRNLMKYRSIDGLFAGLIAISPSFITYVLLISAYFSGDDGMYKTSRSVFMLLHTYGFNLVTTMVDSGLTGIILSAAFFVFLPFIAWFGYTFGYKNLLITKLAMYGKDKPEEN